MIVFGLRVCLSLLETRELAGSDQLKLERRSDVQVTRNFPTFHPRSC